MFDCHFKKNRAFTLVELLVVVAIISLLSSIVIGGVSQARAKARDKVLLQTALQLRNALELYRTDNGNYPGDPNPLYVFSFYKNVEGTVTEGVYPQNLGNLEDYLGDYIGQMPVPTRIDTSIAYVSGYQCDNQTEVPEYAIQINPETSDLDNLPKRLDTYICISAPE